jgi:hypothetical protein
MKIIIGEGFPYGKGEDGECEGNDNLIHAEQQGDDLFVSQELLDTVKEYIYRLDGISAIHHDHTAVYSSSDPERKKEVIK